MQSYTIQHPADLPHSTCDAMAELWFDDMEALQAARSGRARCNPSLSGCDHTLPADTSAKLDHVLRVGDVSPMAFVPAVPTSPISTT